MGIQDGVGTRKGLGFGMGLGLGWGWGVLGVGSNKMASIGVQFRLTARRKNQSGESGRRVGMGRWVTSIGGFD